MLRKVLFFLLVMISLVTAQKSDTMAIKKPTNKVGLAIQFLNGTDPAKKGFYFRNPQATCQLNHGKVSFSGRFDVSGTDHILDAYASYCIAPQWKLQGGRLINWMRTIDPITEQKVFILNPYVPFKNPTSDMGIGIQYNSLDRKNSFALCFFNGPGGLSDNNASTDVMFYFEQHPVRWVVTRGGFQTGQQPTPVGQKDKGFLQVFFNFAGSSVGGSLLQERSNALKYHGWLLEATHTFQKLAGSDSLQLVSRFYNIGDGQIKGYAGRETVIGCQYFKDILKFQVNYVWRENGRNGFLFLCQIWHVFKF